MANKRLTIVAFACLVLPLTILATSVRTGETEEITSPDTDGVTIIIVGEQPDARNQSTGEEKYVDPSALSPAEDATMLEGGMDEDPSPLQKTPPADLQAQPELSRSNEDTGDLVLLSDPPVQIDTTYQYDEIGRLISITKQVQ